MKTFIVGAGSDLGVHIDGAHLGPIQLMNDLKGFYQGESFSLIQNENIIKSRNLSDRRKNEYEIDKFNTELYKVILENRDITLKSKINDLKDTLKFWKDKFEKLISFLHDKLHSWYDKDDKYIDVVNEMYDDNVLDDDDIEDLDLSKEKDDYER